MHPITLIENPKLLQAAKKLAAKGKVAVSHDNLTYLKISDDYIHKLFPLIENKKIHKPDYFKGHDIGAHVSIFYPEENISVDKQDVGQEHQFKVIDFCSTLFDSKHYYILRVESPALLALRKKYGLSDKLCLKKQYITFHITIGLRDL